MYEENLNKNINPDALSGFVAEEQADFQKFSVSPEADTAAPEVIDAQNKIDEIEAAEKITKETIEADEMFRKKGDGADFTGLSYGNVFADDTLRGNTGEYGIDGPQGDQIHEKLQPAATQEKEVHQDAEIVDVNLHKSALELADEEDKAAPQKSIQDVALESINPEKAQEHAQEFIKNLDGEVSIGLDDKGIPEIHASGTSQVEGIDIGGEAKASFADDGKLHIDGDAVAENGSEKIAAKGEADISPDGHFDAKGNAEYSDEKGSISAGGEVSGQITPEGVVADGKLTDFEVKDNDGNSIVDYSENNKSALEIALEEDREAEIESHKEHELISDIQDSMNALN